MEAALLLFRGLTWISPGLVGSKPGRNFPRARLLRTYDTERGMSTGRGVGRVDKRFTATNLAEDCQASRSTQSEERGHVAVLHCTRQHRYVVERVDVCLAVEAGSLAQALVRCAARGHGGR